MADSRHPCLEPPPHLTRRDAVVELPKRVSVLRKLFLRISRSRSAVSPL